MGRRVRITGHPAKRRRSTARSKVRKASAGVANLREQLDRRTRELDDAHQQQMATSEVLSIIRQSPADAQPVFDAIVQGASRLCGALFGVVYLCDDDRLRIVATNNFTPAAAVHLNELQQLKRPERSHLGGRAILDRKIVHVPDVLEDPEYSHEFALAGGWRAVLAVPLLRDGIPLGALTVAKAEVGPFSDRQVQLLTTFADQAVIAIENVRLFEAEQQRARELSESLQQQTATADVLKVISRSTFDLQVVLDTLVQSAARLCEADMASINREKDAAFQQIASYGYSPEFQAFMRDHSIPTGRGSVVGRTVMQGKMIHIPDVLADPEYQMTEAAKIDGIRTMLGVPLLREGTPIGVIALQRKSVRPFTEKQIELVETFADQAVIAIENTRLLNELRERTDDLSESLEQQTATSEVLQVISSSPTDIQPVLDAILQTAGRLCESEYACFFKLQDGAYHLAGSNNAKAEYIKYLSEHPIGVNRGTVVGRAAIERRTVHIPDCLTDPEYTAHENARIGKHRSLLGVPLLRDGVPVGVIGLLRTSVKPYTDKQIELVENFAAQAVIAIENARLLSELRESLQQQTATADVLKVISRSAFHLQSVLDTLLNSAARLCQADHSFIFLREGDVYRCATGSGEIPEWIDYLKQQTIRPGRGTIAARTALEGRTVHIPDVLADPEYTFLEAQKRGGYRTALGVPLLREGVSIGVIVLTRPTVRPFDTSHIALVTTFADQAVIAIENVRLFESVEARTRELTASFEELRTTQDRLVQTQKLALLGQLTAGIAHEIKNPLNFVNNFSGISAELIDELRDILKGVPLDDKARAEIEELTNTLKGNFDKVVHHGRRADAIVKNMLQHSREGSGEHRVFDINALVEESLNLAWHGARAETQGFEVKLKQSFDPSAGGADVFPQDIRRALLNLIANGFYAATRRRAETNGGGYEPTLTASTQNLGDRVEVRIRDNGTGMTPDVKEKMFNPFFTTKPTGEGTGLGLSISHDIIVKQHAGSIEVDTQLGEFTEIRIILPRTAVFL